MSPFYFHLTTAIFLVYCSTTNFASGNSSSQAGNMVAAACNNINGKSNSSGCSLKIDKSKIEEILGLMLMPTINIVEIEVSVALGNNTRYLQKMTWSWASEIGRTIISLVARAKDTIFTSPVFTKILEVGIKKVDIQITEETDGCLPPGKNGSDKVFYFLLRQLSRSKDTHLYKLCRRHENRSLPFNCCRITSGRNLTICADYSSAVVKYSPAGVIVVFVISFFMFLPFVLEHIITYPTNKFYKTSDSHMSLFSILCTIFLEGRGPAKSFFRRLVFAAVSSLVFIPNFCGFLWLKCLFLAWAGCFVLCHDDGIVAFDKDPAFDKIIILGLRQPFSFLFVDMLKFHSNCKNWMNKCCCRGFVICCIAIVYVIIPLPCWIALVLLKFTFADFLLSFIIRENNLPFYEKIWKDLVECIKSFFEKCSSNCCSISTCCNRGCNCVKGSVHDLFVGLIALPYLCISLPFWIIIRLVLCVKRDYRETFFKDLSTHCKIFLRLLTFCNIVYFTGMILMFVLSIVVGLTLNAEFFNPFVAPILTLIVYFWKNWKFSVEANCLQLKTSIIEVCKEKAGPPLKPKTNAGDVTDAPNDMNDSNSNADILSPRVRDTSKEQYTRKPSKNLLSPCSTRGTSEILIGTTEDHGETSGATSGSSSFEDLTSSTCEPTIEETCSKNSNTANTDPKKLTIEFDKHGEAMISKELYEEVSKVILPLDHLLFHFLRRVVFVGLYAFVMFTVMILGQESGVTGSVQVISAIAGAMIPFILDTIYADHHSSQKSAKNMATKERLEHILKVAKLENNVICVELINICNNESQGNQQSPRSAPSVDGAVNDGGYRRMGPAGDEEELIESVQPEENQTAVDEGENGDRNQDSPQNPDQRVNVTADVHK